MSKRLIWAGVVSAMLLSALAIASSSTPPAPTFADTVTVVVEVTLAPNMEPAEALVALGEMRAMMRRQPGYLSEEFLQNLNPSNAPRYVHVSRWASMVYWAGVFRTPEFNRVSAHGNEHYTVMASAFQPVE